MVVYQWKLGGLFPVPAQTAGEEMERIYTKYSVLDASTVVDESRPKDAPLHPCFEWNDTLAAEKYREQQARCIIQSIVVMHETQDAEPIEVRAFLHVAQTYCPVDVILNDADRTRELLETAMKELTAFQRKYRSLEQLKPVFRAIQRIEEAPIMVREH